VLEVSHDQDFAVLVVELFEGGVKPIDQLAADSLGRWGRPLIAQSAGQIE
jgi:hypothetical protein